MKSDCIEWDKCRNKDGYGQVRHESKTWLAHRLAWYLEKGPIPSNMCVLHTCDNPPCVNVEHLFLGTQKDNMKDMVQKGRARKASGENNSNAKLTPSDALEIKALLTQGVVQTRVAEKFGVSQSQISLIKLGKNWKNLYAA